MGLQTLTGALWLCDKTETLKQPQGTHEQQKPMSAQADNYFRRICLWITVSIQCDLSQRYPNSMSRPKNGLRGSDGLRKQWDVNRGSIVARVNMVLLIWLIGGKQSRVHTWGLLSSVRNRWRTMSVRLDWLLGEWWAAVAWVIACQAPLAMFGRCMVCENWKQEITAAGKHKRTDVKTDD